MTLSPRVKAGNVGKNVPELAVGRSTHEALEHDQ
jgi:hypothetical protein